jgi:hypothetical protein
MSKEKVNNRKQQMRERQKKEQQRKNVYYGIAALIVIGIIGFVIFNNSKTEIGDPVDVSLQVLPHVQEGSTLPASKTNPPSGGVHYPSTFPAKFFEPTELAGLPANPQGYLVHNLEHGYVIIWYNCNNLETNACDTLKQEIKDVMAKENGVKLIAFPWDNMDQNVALTSWNRILTMEKFSPSNALQFIRAWRNHSPEPNTP